MEAIQAHPELDIRSDCMGMMKCGKCIVSLISGSLSQQTEAERELLDHPSAETGKMRLACAARPESDCEVELIPSAVEGISVLTESLMALEHINRFPPRKSVPGRYGLALDIGTTTLVCSLVDLESFTEIARAGCMNPQRSYGADVITRIGYASSTEHGLARLQKVLVNAICEMIGRLTEAKGIMPAEVSEICAAGNPTMLHTLAGIDPSAIGVYPYSASFLDSLELDAAELGISVAPSAKILTLPFPSAFVGADITAGLIATGFDKLRGNNLFLDIGTNGEMVLGMDGSYVASSCAAGPALEGMGMRCGCPAMPGAIDHVRLDANGITVSTIGGEPPVGICGSGAIDAVAVMLEKGAISPNGKMVSHDNEGPQAPVFMLSYPETPGKPVYVTQEDVRNIQLAKAAISSGIKIMLELAGLDVKSLDSILIAGEFGAHLNLKSLSRLGILPAEANETNVTFAGNTSLLGAFAAICSDNAKVAAQRLVMNLKTVELASRPDYQDIFVDELNFPDNQG